MNRNNLLFSVIIVVLVLTWFFVIPHTTQYIENEIEKANYCIEDSDCVDAGGKCPFGCYNYVNIVEFERISEMIESYNSKCVYGCVLCTGAKCTNGKCVEICE